MIHEISPVVRLFPLLLYIIHISSLSFISTFVSHSYSLIHSEWFSSPMITQALCFTGLKMSKLKTYVINPSSCCSDGRTDDSDLSQRSAVNRFLSKLSKLVSAVQTCIIFNMVESETLSLKNQCV